MRILVAEDDLDTREFLTLMLEKAGHKVVAKPDGTQAWEALRQDAYPLLLLSLIHI